MLLDSAEDDSDLPDLDDRLVEPGTRYEMLDGELVYVPPCDQPHGRRHMQLGVLVQTHTCPELTAVIDVLLRTSKVDDIAPDVTVYPSARDPQTGRRQLPVLAFEVVSTENMAHATRKAAKLARRGVRRVFAIDVERSRMLEWSMARRGWSVLDPGGHIVDPALAVPLPIDLLIREAETDDEIARALIAKHNPAIEAIRVNERAEGKVEGKIEGKVEGLAWAVIALLESRGVSLATAERERILGERDLAQLERWLVQSGSCASAAELFLAR